MTTMTQTHDGMTPAEYLADMNRELMSMGLRPVSSIEEARRGARQTSEVAMEDPWSPKQGNGARTSWKVAKSDEATNAQIKYIISLTEQITGIRDEIEDVQRQGFTKAEASAMIERLRPLAAEARDQRYATAVRETFVKPSIESVTDGMYLMNGMVYKVQIAKQGSGRLYAKVLRQGGFEYAPGVVNKLRPEHRMTLEQAQEYGKLYGVCCRCGRDLTDEESIANGIGPICAGKF